MVPQKQVEEAIVPAAANMSENDDDEGERERSSLNLSLSIKSLLWHGGSVYDAWFSCASSQVAQVLLTLPYLFSQVGMVFGVIFQVFYGILGSWTAHLISTLYVEYRTRKEKQNVNFKNHVIQQHILHQRQVGQEELDIHIQDVLCYDGVYPVVSQRRNIVVSGAAHDLLHCPVLDHCSPCNGTRMIVTKFEGTFIHQGGDASIETRKRDKLMHRFVRGAMEQPRLLVPVILVMMDRLKRG